MPRHTVGFDHVLLFVDRDAPQRQLLERAGFRIAPGLNQHEGQGTASVTIEFENAFVELIWPDDRVRVDAPLARAAERFRQRAAWRTSGACPIAIALHRSTDVTAFPFPTWSVTAPWMDPGTSLVMLTARDDLRSPSISVHPHDISKSSARDARQPNGVRRVTAVRLFTPSDYTPVEPLRYLEHEGVLRVSRGDGWAIELTLDNGRTGAVDDFRPDLPLIVRR